MTTKPPLPLHCPLVISLANFSARASVAIHTISEPIPPSDVENTVGEKGLTDCGLDVAGRTEWKCRGIDYPQTLDTIDSSMGVDDGVWIAGWAHGA